MHKYITIEFKEIIKLEDIKFLENRVSICIICISTNISDTLFLAFNNPFQFRFWINQIKISRGPT